MTRILSFFTGNLWGSLFVAALTLAIAQTARIEGAWFIHGFKDEVASLTTKNTQLVDDVATEKAAHKQTKANYHQAELLATAQNKQHVALVEANQERINNDRSSSYQRRIADLNAQRDRLRQHTVAGTSAASASGTTSVSQVPNTPPGADEEAQYNASIQAIQLDELITWVEQQEAGSARLREINVLQGQSPSHRDGDEADRNDIGALAAH